MTTHLLILLAVPTLTTFFGAQCASRLVRGKEGMTTLSFVFAIGLILALFQTAWVEELMRVLFSRISPQHAEFKDGLTDGVLLALRAILLPIVIGSVVFSTITSLAERLVGRPIGKLSAVARPAVLAGFLLYSFQSSYAELLSRSLLSLLSPGGI